MVSRWFVALIELLILITCALPISEEILRLWSAVEGWGVMLFKHPTKAIRLIWEGFWNSWLAVITVWTFMCSFIFLPQFAGYGLSRTFVVVANFVLLLKLCITKELHGTKASRKPAATRTVIIAIFAVLFAALSLFECGMVTNSERGSRPTVANIWKSSEFWHDDVAAPEPSPDEARVSVGAIEHVPGSSQGGHDTFMIAFKNYGKLKATQVANLTDIVFATSVPLPSQSQTEPQPLPEDQLFPHKFETLHDNRWSALMKNSSLELDQGDGRMFPWPVATPVVNGVLAGKTHLYFIVVFKYKDDSMADDVVGVTEFCGYLFERLDYFYDCGSKSHLERVSLTPP
jgi:hypothetical protein